MKIGFHYHSPFITVENNILVPGYIGVFIDELARQVETLILFLEESEIIHAELDYTLTQKNIKVVSLGSKSSFYHRVLFPQNKTAIVKKHVAEMDCLLLRSPSPLSPHLVSALQKNIPVYNLLVGNYVNGLKDLQQPLHRKLGIILLTLYYQYLQNKALRGAKTLVNSHALMQENQYRAKEITLVKTTTLDATSFYNRIDTCTGNTIRILYTGRINFQKGLRELIQAVAKASHKYPIVLDIVGWEDPGKFNYTEALKKLAIEHGIANRVVFHGRKKVGPELLTYYRNADIYCIPSYHEGFPRTIWEAMANSLPVIATKVGSIPHYINEQTAKLIEPKNTSALTAALEELIANKTIRQSYIQNGWTLAQECTLEKQTTLIINTLKKYNSEK